MSARRAIDVPEDVTDLLERAISLVNEDLGGVPLADRLELDQPSLSVGDLANRVRAMVRLRTFLNSMINAEALLAVEQGGSYAVVGSAAGVSKARAHQLWPRPKLFPADEA